MLQGFEIQKLNWSQSDVEIFRYRIAIELEKGIDKADSWISNEANT